MSKFDLLTRHIPELTGGNYGKVVGTLFNSGHAGTKKITAEPEPEREKITGKSSLFQIMKSWINTKR